MEGRPFGDQIFNYAGDAGLQVAFAKCRLVTGFQDDNVQGSIPDVSPVPAGVVIRHGRITIGRVHRRF